MKTATKIALSYGRVSTSGQEDNTSKENQQTACKTLAERHGLTIEAEYFDVYSGASLDRPELIRLRQRVRDGGIAAVLCYDPDRLSRKASHAYILRDFFEKYGVELLFVNAPSSKLDDGIRILLAEIEREKITLRLSDGKRNRQLQGSILGKNGMIYGYDCVRVPDPSFKAGKGTLVINEEQAYWVRKIFQWAVEGVPTTRIAHRLHEMGVPTKRGGTWQRTTIRHILANSTYIGVHVANKTQKVAPQKPQDNYKGRKYAKPEFSAQRQRDESEWIKIPCPAIVSEDEWRAANERVKLNKIDSVHTPKYEYLLRSLVFCADCSHRMSPRKGGSPGSPQRYFQCNHRPHYANRCKVRPQRVDRLEKDVWDGIALRLRNPEIIKEGIERHAREANRNQEHDESELVIIASSLQKLAADEGKLLDLHLDNLLSKDLLQAKAEQIHKERAGLEREYQDLQARIEARSIATAHLHVLEALGEAVGDELDYLDFNAKRSILEALQTRITVYKEGPPTVECILTEESVSLLEWSCEKANAEYAETQLESDRMLFLTMQYILHSQKQHAVRLPFSFELAGGASVNAA